MTAMPTDTDRQTIPATDEMMSFTIRRKVFKIFGAGSHIYDDTGALVGYGKQKALRIREDIRIFTDESLADEMMRISTKSVLDISGLSMVDIPGAGPIGGFKRRCLKSMFWDTWNVVNAQGNEIGTIQEDSGFKAIARRAHGMVAALLPHKFLCTATDGTHIATYQTHMNPFVYRLSVTIHTTTPDFDTLLLVAGGCFISAIEGRR